MYYWTPQGPLDYKYVSVFLHDTAANRVLPDKDRAKSHLVRMQIRLYNMENIDNQENKIDTYHVIYSDIWDWQKLRIHEYVYVFLYKAVFFFFIFTKF